MQTPLYLLYRPSFALDENVDYQAKVLEVSRGTGHWVVSKRVNRYAATITHTHTNVLRGAVVKDLSC